MNEPRTQRSIRAGRAMAGRTCVGVRRIVHRFAGASSTKLNALELAWDGGAFTTVDVNADWTLCVVDMPWVDPFAGATKAELDRCAREVGLLEPAAAGEDLERLVGQKVVSVELLSNEMAELTGIRAVFAGLVLVARMWAGDLEVRVDGAAGA